MQINQLVCDSCQATIYGKKGIADMTKEHIRAKGMFTFEKWDWIKKRYEFRFLTRENEELAFCNMQCFHDFFSQKINKANDQLLKAEINNCAQTGQ
jgi:hypothetical protein